MANYPNVTLVCVVNTAVHGEWRSIMRRNESRFITLNQIEILFVKVDKQNDKTMAERLSRSLTVSHSKSGVR